MNTRPLVIAIAITVLWRPALGSPTRAPGCAAPEATSKALEAISKSDWDGISETDLAAMWPTQLAHTDCDSGACRTLTREDRTINDECVCCESFHFQIDRKTEGTLVTEHLDSLVIHYASDNRSEILALAKQFARAMGMPAQKATTIKPERSEQFDWDVDRGKVIALMTVQVWHERGIWKLYLIMDHHPL